MHAHLLSHSVWAGSEGRLLTSLSGHEGGVSALARVDDETFVSAGWDHALKIWSVCPHLPRGPRGPQTPFWE